MKGSLHTDELLGEGNRPRDRWPPRTHRLHRTWSALRGDPVRRLVDRTAYVSPIGPRHACDVLVADQNSAPLPRPRPRGIQGDHRRRPVALCESKFPR
jgi:hypothetical protein